MINNNLKMFNKIKLINNFINLNFTYYYFIIIFFNKNFLLNYYYFFKYSNLENNNEFFIKQFSIKNIQNKNNTINNIVKIKKKTSILKKKNDYNFIILNYVNVLKNNFDKNYFNFNVYKNSFIDIKNFDLSRRKKLIIKDNRFLLKKFFELKYFRKKNINKNIIKLSNFNKLDFLYNLEYSLINILMKSDFFLSKNDCLWFLSKGLISVNFVIEKNKNKILKINDIINLSYSNIYFSFYKKTFFNSLNSIYKINKKLWSIQKNRINNTNLKENYPNWINNYKYFKNEIPLNLEIDFLTLSIYILNYNFKYENISKYNLKFLNIYLNRL